MIIDEDATARAPGRWEIWRTTSQWQAMHPDCTSQGDGLHGELHRGPGAAARAVTEARQLEERRLARWADSLAPKMEPYDWPLLDAIARDGLWGVTSIGRIEVPEARALLTHRPGEG